MMSYFWPGNIRELKNTVERAVYREDGSVVSSLNLDPFWNPWNESDDSPGSTELPPETINETDVLKWPRNIKDAVRNLEEQWLKDALEEAAGHQGRAAELLGLSYDQFRGLYRRIRPEE